MTDGRTSVFVLCVWLRAGIRVYNLNVKKSVECFFFLFGKLYSNTSTECKQHLLCIAWVYNHKHAKGCRKKG